MTDKLSASALDDLKAISAELSTQDNDATSAPVYTVQQRRRVYGFDPSYSDNPVWVMDGGEADPTEAVECEANEDEAESNGWTKTAYVDQWEFVTACLTRKAAEAFIASQRHNLCDPRIYTEGGSRNREWVTLRAAVPALVAEVTEARARTCETCYYASRPDEMPSVCRLWKCSIPSQVKGCRAHQPREAT
jgi:hypothetical protein